MTNAPKVLVSVVATSAALVVASPGCNVILDNERGVLAVTDEAGTLPIDDGGPGAPRPPEPTPSVDGSAPEADDVGDAGLPCPTGQRLCGGRCVASSDPEHGCGSPTCTPCVVPRAVAACMAGACAVGTCDAGFADCNATAKDGCEVDLSRAETCGSCTRACQPETPVCAPVGDGHRCTTGCPSEAPVRCGDDCVDLRTSPAHCGECDVRCPEVENARVTCAGGTCRITCRHGLRACAGVCVARSDPAACGPDCVACPVAPNTRALCVDDACALRCRLGFADCDATVANGCEAELARDPLNCGDCGRSCDGADCVDGVCEPGPDADVPPDGAAPRSSRPRRR